MCRLDAVWFKVLFGFMQVYCHNKCLNQNYTQQHFLCITDKICFSSQQRPKVRSRGSHLFQREQQPPHSEWSRCYRQSSDTGPRGRPGFQSGPEREQQDIQLHGKVAVIKRRRTWQSQRSAVDSMSGRTAVWAVIWVQPTIFAPASGFSPWALFLKEIRADMSGEEKI